MAQNRVLVVGSLNMDQVVHVPRMPLLGETLLGAGSLRFVPGGKGANQAVAMTRLGGKDTVVMMAGRVGNDPFGEQLVQALQRDAVDTSLIVVDQEEASGTAFIFLGPDGDNAIVVAGGANMRVGHDQNQLATILSNISQASALVLQLEIPLETVQTLITAGQQAGVPVVLNLAPAQPLPPEILKQVSVLVVNESEAGLLTERRVESLEDARAAGTTLHQLGVDTVALTLGARGALLFSSNQAGNTQVSYQAAPKVQVVDTTAAGDCFVGALTIALTEKQSAEDALRFAVTASALKVTKFGAQSGLPTRQEVLTQLAGPRKSRKTER